MTTPTLADLLAQQEALTLKIEAQEIPALSAIKTALEKPTIAAALSTLEANLGSLTGERLTQANNLITTLTHCPSFLRDQLAAIEARQVYSEPPEA